MNKILVGVCSVIWREKLRLETFQEALVFLYQIVRLQLVSYVENKLDPKLFHAKKKEKKSYGS